MKFRDGLARDWNKTLKIIKVSSDMLLHAYIHTIDAFIGIWKKLTWQFIKYKTMNVNFTFFTSLHKLVDVNVNSISFGFFNEHFIMIRLQEQNRIRCKNVISEAERWWKYILNLLYKLQSLFLWRKCIASIFNFIHYWNLDFFFSISSARV